jgi:hypothetical protein
MEQKHYLHIPFCYKDEVKKLVGQWDSGKKQ